jgi:hypothetical protein
LRDALIDAHFAAFTAGKADDVVVEDGEGAERVAKFVRGRPVGHIHKRADFWVEHLHPDPYVRGILAITDLRFPSTGTGFRSRMKSKTMCQLGRIMTLSEKRWQD